MPSAHKEIGTRVTPAQLAAITEAARRANLPLAEFLRYAAMMACHAEGVTMPDDMPNRGRYPRADSTSGGDPA